MVPASYNNCKFLINKTVCCVLFFSSHVCQLCLCGMSAIFLSILLIKQHYSCLYSDMLGLICHSN